MIRFSRAFLILALFWLPAILPAHLSAQELPFQAGESADLVINYRVGIKAELLHARIDLTEEEGDFRVVLTAATTKFWDSIYRVRDTFACRFTPALQPVDYRRDVHEGDYWAKSFCTWNEDASVLRLVGDKPNRPHRDTTYTDPMLIRDIMNLIYTLRSNDPDIFSEAGPQNYLMIVDKDLIDLRVRFAGREEKKIRGLGTCNALKYAVAMRTRKGTQPDEAEEHSLDSSDSTKETMFFWFSDDENRMLLFFTMPLSVGALDVRTVRFEGLKYPFTALKENG